MGLHNLGLVRRLIHNYRDLNLDIGLLDLRIILLKFSLNVSLNLRIFYSWRILFNLRNILIYAARRYGNLPRSTLPF